MRAAAGSVSIGQNVEKVFAIKRFGENTSGCTR